MIQRFSDVNIHIQWFRNTVMQKIYTSTPRCDAKSEAEIQRRMNAVMLDYSEANIKWSKNKVI